MDKNGTERNGVQRGSLRQSPQDSSLDKLTFEEAFKKLEDNVLSLEKGDIGLEEAIRIYEEGIMYSDFLMKKLDSAEKRVEELTAKNNNASGEKSLSLKPLETD